MHPFKTAARELDKQIKLGIKSLSLVGINQALFDSKEADCLKPRGLLSNFCLDALSRLLANNFRAVNGTSATLFDVSLFSNNSLSSISNTIRESECWKTKAWIVPIHIDAPEHWMTATIYPQERRIQLFDSLNLPRNLIQSVIEVC